MSTASKVGWRGAAALGLACALAAPMIAEPQRSVAATDEQAGIGPAAKVVMPDRAKSKAGKLAGNDTSRAGQEPLTIEGALGGVGGLALDDPVVLCTQPAANCQYADQLGHGEGGIIGATSDVAAGFLVSDNFTTSANARILSVCWWGFYNNFDNGEDCVPVPTDDFTIRFLTNLPGCPSGQPDAEVAAITQAQFTSFTRSETGNLVGGNIEYEYTATFITNPFDVDTCYWIEIANNTPATPEESCFWLFSTAASASEDPPGNGDSWSWQSGTTPPSNDFDLAFCIDMALADQAICSAAAVPVPACIGATGECWKANDSTGCNDECCCTLVCNEFPLCCIADWTDQCATTALDLGCTVVPPVPLCAEGEPGEPGVDPAICQVYTQVVAYMSTSSPAPLEDFFVAADDFTPLNDSTITEVCWQGVYGTAPVVDNFRVRILGDAGGFPDVTNVVLDEIPVSVTRESTNIVWVDPRVIWQYRAPVTATQVLAGECYWLEVTNEIGETGEVWFWDSADGGNGRIVIDGFGPPGDTPPDGYDALDVIGGVDLSFCLTDCVLDSPACGFETLHETGNHEVVLFNGAPSNLGWSSGDIGPGPPPDHQRRTAQAFTIPPLPPGDVNAWSIEQITLEGFQPDDIPAPGPGVGNEFLNYEIFARTSLDQDIQEADSVALLDLVGPLTGEVADASFPNEFTVVITGLFLDPGDYWLTFWASNSSAEPGDPQPNPSNLAWFTNAPDGINNFCTESMPPPADPYDGCFPSDPDGEPAGTPAMLRARVWPPAALPSDGFGAYTLQPDVLDVAPGDDPTPDPNDLYNAAFRIRGAAVAVAPPCPCDCQTEPNGSVDVQDFLALLAQWGGAGSCDCDSPPDGVVDVQDFLAILATWGPCPE
ncbi:MAG: GC-type dockerin domain-anchored protein [Planctomycetota bacterium]|jgi:hypothetical protein